MSMRVDPIEAMFAVTTAIEGHRWFLYKWQGEYGKQYREKDGTNPIRDNRIAEIENEIERLKAFKKTLDC